MSAELLRHKELERTSRPQPLAPGAAEDLPRRGAMLVLRHSSTPLLALPPQGPPTPPREPARRAPRKGDSSPAPTRPSEPKEATGTGLWAHDGCEEEPPKDSDGEDPEMVAVGGLGATPGQAPAGGASSEGKGLLSGSVLPPPLPLGLPYAISPYFHTGGHRMLSVPLIPSQGLGGKGPLPLECPRGKTLSSPHILSEQSGQPWADRGEGLGKSRPEAW